MARMSEDDRLAALKKATKHVLDPKEVQRIEPMTFLEELMAVFIFFFFVPGSVISIPALTFIIGYLTGQYKIVCSIVGVITLYFTFVPIRFKDSSLTSWWALQILRYFSFKGIFEETLQNHKPYILVAPPHGVFPFGNITTMIAFPSLMGFSFRGLAASAAVAMPFFRQFLCTIGAIDASRSTATKVSLLLTMRLSCPNALVGFEQEPGRRYLHRRRGGDIRNRPITLWQRDDCPQEQEGYCAHGISHRGRSGAMLFAG